MYFSLIPDMSQFNLAWKLALSLKSRSSPALLSTYESERLPVIAEMLNITTELFNKIASKSESRRGIEAAQAQSARKDKDDERYTRDRKLFQLDVNYRWSEIIFDERFTKDEGNDVAARRAYGTAGHDIRAGDRSPDAPGLTSVAESTSETTPSRLFDVFKPTAHTVLLFTSDPSGASVSSLLAPFSEVPKDLIQVVLILPPEVSTRNVSAPVNISYVFRDSEGHAYNGYGLKPGGEEIWAVIVRPDGMIGAFAKTVEGVEKYRSLVFA